jgi:hypothetical protein
MGTTFSLDTALGKPKYFIDTPGKKEGEKYFWFPTQGDSMTCHGANHSIPGGSLVLGRLLPVAGLQGIPLQQPVVVIIDDNGQQFCMLKVAVRVTEACASEYGTDQVVLHSYNKRYNDFSIPFSCVKFLFVVERVRLPDGGEFEIK